jgi:hypothetical protein
VPTEVLATPRADQQIAGLDRTHARAFGEFLDDLAARGCKALGYRLSGPAPVDHLCVKHLRDSLRVVVAFEGQQRAWILLVGRHDAQDPVLNVYAELYRLLGVEPPTAPDGISRRAATRTRTCRQSSARPSPNSSTARQRSAGQGASRRRYRDAARPWSKGMDRELALFVTCRRLALQSREVIRHKGTVVSRSVTILCKLDIPYPSMCVAWQPPRAVISGARERPFCAPRRFSGIAGGVDRSAYSFPGAAPASRGSGASGQMETAGCRSYLIP